jgi:uncharacterized membrane protein
MKKVMALTVAFMLLFSSFCLAAVSSSKSRPASRPSTSTSSSVNTAPQTKQAAPSDASGYKPTAPANSYSDKAPSSQAKPGTQTNQSPSNSGGFWRSAGMFGAGMLAGSFLSNMFGFGNMGAMSSIFGVLINILLIMAVIMAVRFIWNKLRGRDKRNM